VFIKYNSDSGDAFLSGRAVQVEPMNFTFNAPEYIFLKLKYDGTAFELGSQFQPAPLHSGYGGEYRGVLFTPELGDGAFRQYGYLPLDLPAGGGDVDEAKVSGGD
jgi:hypothetical protein